SIVFFFSSRRRHTRFSRDWSSDVCSSDLGAHCRVIEPSENIEDQENFLKIVRGKEKQYVDATRMDVLWIRYDPVVDMINRPWAPPTALQFAQQIGRAHV